MEFSVSWLNLHFHSVYNRDCLGVDTSISRNHIIELIVVGVNFDDIMVSSIQLDKIVTRVQNATRTQAGQL